MAARCRGYLLPFRSWPSSKGTLSINGLPQLPHSVRRRRGTVHTCMTECQTTCKNAGTTTSGLHCPVSGIGATATWPKQRRSAGKRVRDLNGDRKFVDQRASVCKTCCMRCYDCGAPVLSGVGPLLMVRRHSSRSSKPVPSNHRGGCNRRHACIRRASALLLQIKAQWETS